MPLDYSQLSCCNQCIKDNNGNKLGLLALCVSLGLYRILSRLNLCMYVFAESNQIKLNQLKLNKNCLVRRQSNVLIQY